MLLNKLFKNAPEIEIEQLSTDSRIAMNNAVFFALPGIRYDGHDYIDEAISNGAKVIVFSDEINKNARAIYIKVKDVFDTFSKVANIFYNYPSKDLEIYEVSGNYGKSSVAKIINHCLNKHLNCAYVGILGIQYNGLNLPMSFPTMSALDNIKTLDLLRNNDVKAVTFEATSSSMNLHKVDVVKPDVFVFTGCNERSSEFGSTNHEYYNWISRYFYTLEDSTKIILNRDDQSFNEFKNTVDNYVSCGKSEEADYRFFNEEYASNSTSFILEYNGNKYEIKTSLIGEANIYNVVFAIAALNQKGFDINEIIKDLSDLTAVAGVYEKVDPDYNVFVDCAYDICSIENVLSFAKNNCKGKVISLMAINCNDTDSRVEKLVKVLNKYSDVVLLTEDESDENEVMSILNRSDEFNNQNKIVKLIYRSIAIQNGIELLNRDDCFFILGKGNEKFMIMGLGKEKYPGDAAIAKKYINKRKEEEYETK